MKFKNLSFTLWKKDSDPAEFSEEFPKLIVAIMFRVKKGEVLEEKKSRMSLHLISLLKQCHDQR
jgi:hypothetical protein